MMPLLVSGAGMSAQEAVPISLLVVALMSIVNLGPYVRRHQVAPRAALVLGIPALAGAWIGGSLVKAGWVSETAQLSIFAAAALAAAWFMIRRDLQEQRPQSKAVQPREPAPALALAGKGWCWGCSPVWPALVEALRLCPPWCCWRVCRCSWPVAPACCCCL